MKDTGPEAVPPEESSSLEARIRREVEPGTGPTLEDLPLLLVPVEDRVHRVVDGEDEAGADLLRAGRADVEPHRGVEREHLVQQRIGQLVLEDLGVLVGPEVAVLLAGLGVGEHDAVDELAQRPLAGRRAERAAEVLRRDDRAALTDQKSGNSTPRCSKIVSPVFQLVWTTSRRSQVTSS
jgi:hypothetical protein